MDSISMRRRNGSVVCVCVLAQLLTLAFVCSGSLRTHSSTLGTDIGSSERVMTEACAVVAADSDDNVPSVIQALCLFHPLVYGPDDFRYQPIFRHGHNLRTHRPKLAYQMYMEQYLAITSTLLEVTNPSMLFYGCGADTPVWKKVVERAQGSVVFLDDSAEWIGNCRESGADVRLVKYHGSVESHRNLLKGVWTQEDELMDLDEDLIREYDVIVVDGPRGVVDGRSMSLYTAGWLARRAPTTHNTHIFLHDTQRPFEKVISEVLLGMRAEDGFVGITVPGKGLTHWMVRGQSRLAWAEK
eukprot:TRINITY_DN15153_c0_g1_i1.p1 TRINITY_DN15153_c0_g1~~TRINITY_DN15153_c0_g1_i1.p1  ORF type:complete len:299 (+),score=25.23 TRINITY_DN15153_c0_g1_i1:379-1275(+)